MLVLQIFLHPKKCIFCVIQHFFPLFCVYNNLFWIHVRGHIFLIQMKYRLQSMYNCMVGQAASFPSPFYSILLDKKEGAEHYQFKVNNSKIYKTWIEYLQSIFYSWNRWTVSMAWRAMRRKILETFILNSKNNERLLVSCLIMSFPRKYDSLNIEQSRQKQIVKKVIYFLYNRIFDFFNDVRRN